MVEVKVDSEGVVKDAVVTMEKSEKIACNVPAIAMVQTILVPVWITGVEQSNDDDVVGDTRRE